MPREGPVLDVGCGRGEWLELLRQENIPARGVEENRLMAAECRERSLDAEHADALEYLARTADGSAGAVTVLRLVENLPLHRLVRLIDEAARVLRPGGTTIFATPNPDNLLVSGRDFYRDPVRHHPVPSETLRSLLEARGFETEKVLFLNPAGEDERIPEEGEGAAARRFNRLFFGPRDYAVVCRKVPLSRQA
jgi:SAM-dependent methyltransferase